LYVSSDVITTWAGSFSVECAKKESAKKKEREKSKSAKKKSAKNATFNISTYLQN
jgi:hypothetical protein